MDGTTNGEHLPRAPVVTLAGLAPQLRSEAALESAPASDPLKPAPEGDPLKRALP